MARNRMIKPEFWSDAKIGKLSLGARLLFIGIWNFADDYGVISASPRRLLGEVFENDESVSLDNISEWIEELVGSGRLVRFNADEKVWLYVKRWKEHQKVDSPSQRRNPSPPKDLGREEQESGGGCSSGDPEIGEDATGVVPDPSGEHAGESRESRESLARESRQKEKEKEKVKGKEKEGERKPPREFNPGLIDPEAELWKLGCDIFGEDPNDLGLTSERRKVLKEIRANAFCGWDAFLSACRNRAGSTAPGEISIAFFTDNPFEAVKRVTKWKKGAPIYGGNTGSNARSNDFVSRDADKGDGSGWDSVVRKFDDKDERSGNSALSETDRGRSTVL